MEQNAKLICQLFKGTKPFLIGRNGTIELEVLTKYLSNISITESEKNKLELNAGVYPEEQFEDYYISYIEALRSVDVMAEGWYEPLKRVEKEILDKLNPRRSKVVLRNLEPYYVKPELRWTQHLNGKRVAIINSFAETCEEQTYMSKAIWPDQTESLLPSETTWIPIRTFYSPRLADNSAGWPSHIKCWKEAIRYIVEKTVEERCDVAIIGCGGIGMIVGYELKKRGLQCIVMGGATQILFGIKGRRWKAHDVISRFFNDAWVYPPDSCKPNNSKLVENGCYW